jgi:hypothetical protein
MILATLLHLFPSSAIAGKLGAGWRGHPYGDAAWLAKAPGAHCKSNPEEGVAWRCWEVIGSSSYDASYMVNENLYTGVLLSCTTFAGCDQLLTVMQEAWGTCVPGEYTSGALPDCSFGAELGTDAPPTLVNEISIPGVHVGRVYGNWDYNPFSDQGYALAMSLDLMAEVKARKAAKAHSAVEDL